MDGFILAAGLGTRMLPLTSTKPKALLPVGGVPLLERCINRLSEAGCKHLVVNVHHFAAMVKDFIASRRWEVAIDISDESDMLLDTGGALKKAAPLFNDDNILVYNVDILSRFSLQAMLQQHQQTGNDATLAVSRRDTSRQLLLDDRGRLRGWHNRDTDETRWVSGPATTFERAFSGIAIVTPRLIGTLPEADHPYPIIPEYLRAAKEQTIGTFEHDAAQWIDVGKPETYKEAEHFVNQ